MTTTAVLDLKERSLPAEWSLRTVADLGEFRGGGTPSTARPELWNGKIHWTTSKRISDSIEIQAGEKFISELGLKESATSLIPKGNLVVGTRVGVGKAAVNRVDLAISQDLTGVIVDKTEFNPFFVAYQLREQRAQRIFATQNRGTTIKGIPREDLKAIEIFTPPVPEQEKIAAMLWKIQTAVGIEDAIVRNARDLKKSLLRRLFTHGLRGESLKETEIGPLPQSWEVIELRDAATFASGGTPSKQEATFWDGEIPWVSPKDMKSARLHDTEDHISKAGLAAGSNLVHDGALFVVVRGMILNRDLPVAMARKPMAFNQDIKAVLPNERVIGDFLLYTLQNEKRRLFNQIGTSAHGTRTLMSEYLAKFQFGLPEIPEQRQIADILQSVDRKIDIHESKKRSLQELFKTMLHKLMTAQIRLEDLDIDTTEVTQ